MGEEMGAGARRWPRWMVLALTISVGANLLLGGLVVGAALRDAASDRRKGFTERVLSELPEARRAEAREILSASAEGWPERRARMAAASAEISAALSAEPFDPDALRRAMDARLDVMRGHFADRGERLVKVAEMLGAEERARLAEAMAARSARRLERIDRRLARD